MCVNSPQFCCISSFWYTQTLVQCPHDILMLLQKYFLTMRCIFYHSQTPKCSFVSISAIYTWISPNLLRHMHYDLLLLLRKLHHDIRFVIVISISRKYSSQHMTISTSVQNNWWTSVQHFWHPVNTITQTIWCIHC